MRELTIDEQEVVSGGFGRTEYTTWRADPFTVTAETLKSWFEEIKNFFNTQDHQNTQALSDYAEMLRNCESSGGSPELTVTETQYNAAYALIRGSSSETKFSFVCRPD